MRLGLPGSELKKTDINRLLAATVAGGLSSALLYTVFGFIFCRLHAARISAEMSLFTANGMAVVVRPNDPYLASFLHQLGSGAFFGLTLGLLIGISAAAAGTVIFFTANDKASSKIIQASLMALVALFAAIAGYSRELPYISILFGLLSPAAFFIPWLLIISGTREKDTPYIAWLVFLAIICLPLILFKSQSYELIRDAMVDTPVLRGINEFYYNHTFLAADVIKPLSVRTQNALAVSKGIGEIMELPHGTLIIKTEDPCSVKGAAAVISEQKLSCSSIIPEGGTGVISAAKILKDVSGDPNKMLRKSIGTFLKGPIILVPVIILGWAAFGLACLFRKRPVIAVIIVLCYLTIFIPGFYHAWLKKGLYSDSSKIHEYASSSNPAKRYYSLVYMLDRNVEHTDGLYPDELRALAGDSQASTRLNALVLIGELKALQFMDIVMTSLGDSQLNVRTKACWAVGKIGTADTASILEGVMNDDPSWYVRDYAYTALSKTGHESKIVIR